MFTPLILAAAAAQGSFTIEADNHWDGLGMTVWFIGDINGDGFREFGTSAFCTDLNANNSGTLYIYDGATQALIRRHDGIGPQARLGEFATAVGDVDGDGFIDYAGGARNENFAGLRYGSVYVFSGLTGDQIHRLDGYQTDAEFGWYISDIGDINGDGHDDLAVGSPRENNSNGAVRFFSGKTGKLWYTANGQVPKGHFGHCFTKAGDVDQDGIGDIAISAPWADKQSGQIVVYSGATFAILERVHGTRDGARLGARMADARDFDGDGHLELMVSEPCFDTVYLVDLRLGMIERQHQGQRSPTKSGVGHAFGPCGDVDGDGYEDYLISRPGDWDWNFFINKGPGGSVQIISGLTGQIITQAWGEELDDGFGGSMDLRVDAAGPGQPVLLVGAPAAGDLVNGHAPGKVYGLYPQNWTGGASD